MAPPPPYGYPPGPPVVEKTVMPVIGGILILIGALVGIATGAFFIVGASLFMPIDITGFGLSELMAVCGIIIVVISIIALLGGIFAMQRKAFGFAIVGGILSMLVGSFIFGLIGLILVAISRKEFR
jgi:hypothetical protein